MFFFFQLSVTSSELFFSVKMSKKINPFHLPQLHFTFSPDPFFLLFSSPCLCAGFSLNIHQELSLSLPLYIFFLLLYNMFIFLTLLCIESSARLTSAFLWLLFLDSFKEENKVVFSRLCHSARRAVGSKPF